MAKIYLDVMNGADRNDGLAATQGGLDIANKRYVGPVKTMLRAIAQAQSGDDILVSGTAIDNPTRGMVIFGGDQSLQASAQVGQLAVPAGVTIRSSVPGVPFWHSGVMDISPGATSEQQEHRGVFTAYTSWGVVGTPAITATLPLFGAGSVRCSSGAYIRRGVYYHNGDNLVAQMRKYRWHVLYRSENGTSRLSTRIEAQLEGFEHAFDTNPAQLKWRDSNFYDAYDNQGVLANATNYWDEYVSPWFGPESALTGATAIGGGPLTSFLSHDAGFIDVALVWLEEMPLWIESATPRVWQTNYRSSVMDSSVLGRQSADDNGNLTGYGTGISGMFFSSDSADYTAYRISEGNGTTTIPTADLCSFFSGSHATPIHANVARFKVPSGKSLADYKIYLTSGQYPFQFVGAAGDVKPSVVDCNVICAQYPYLAKGTASWSVERFRSLVNLREARTIETASMHWQGGGSWQPIHSPIAKLYGGGTVAGDDASDNISNHWCHGLHHQFAGDDAFQNIGKSNVYVRGCTEDGAGGYPVEQNCNAATGNGGIMSIIGFTTSGIIRDQSTDATTLELESVVCDYIALEGVSRNTSVITIGENVLAKQATASGYGISYGGGATQAVIEAANPTVVSVTPGYVEDYVADINNVPIPAADSVLVGAGNKWWSGVNPIGANGEPFSDWQTDIGGVQTLRGQFHPANM